MQVTAMRVYAKRKDWQVILKTEEIGSGAKTRPRREELLRAARRKEIDAIVVWRLDRWGRFACRSREHIARAGRSESRLRLLVRGD